MAEVTLQDSLFSVSEVPAIGLQKATGDEVQLGTGNTGYKFIVRDDTGAILSCMTDEYRLVDNTTIYETAKPIMKDIGAVLNEIQTFSGGAKTSWRWTLKDVKVDLGDGDMLNPEITIKNSYNGQWGLHILAGAFRLVCSNGMIIGVVISRKNYKHSIYNVSLDDIAPSINDTVLATQGIFNTELPILKETQVKEEHIVELIKMIPSTHMEAFTQYLMAHKPTNYWELLNAATWIATHSMARRNEATHKLEQQIYPKITKWAGVKSIAKA
jgi:hypothetical protein